MGYEMTEGEINKFNEEQYPSEWLAEDYKRKGWKLTNGVEKFK